MGKIVALTGAAGYLGRVLTAYLQTQPWVDRIIALDLKPIRTDRRVISYQMDIRDTSFLRAVLGEHGVTNLIHGAFLVSQPQGMTAEQMRQNNVEGSREVIHTSLELGIEHLIFISSVSIYGYRTGHPFNLREDGSWKPNMVYGRHKAEVESYLNEQRKKYPRTQVAVIRPTAVVGPLGRTMSHLRALTAQPVFVLSNGGRAMTQALHEEDAASLVAKAVELNAAGVYNAAPNDYASWADIARLSRLTVISAPRLLWNFSARFSNVIPQLNGFTREIVDYFSETLVVDNTAARKALNWFPRHSTLETFNLLFGAAAPIRERIRVER